MNIRILTAQDVRAALPMPIAVERMKQAFIQYSAGKADVPLRSRIDVKSHQGTTLFMPALLHATEDLAVKIVSVYPENIQRNLPTIHALVVVIDPLTGAPQAILEGASLTAIRTGAASGAATDLLARQDAHTVAIFGSGTQARTQLEAVCCVREIQQAWVYSLDPPGAHAFCEEMQTVQGVPEAIEIAATPRAAAEYADIICAATTSSKPVFQGEHVCPGTHINAIGSFTPEMQELDANLLQKAFLVVDSREAVLAESGDLIIPIEQGLLDRSSIHAELGEVLSNDVPGRSGEDQITVFKSVGLAVQDAIAASTALAGAQDANIGVVVEI
jgi:ornithine cyclodeaminase/alanine dehydrogenase-like protein (mu-crystallin family)